MNRQHAIPRLFGPVPSRRLGLSLGVDLVPFKICSFDCVFCQLGRTTKLTTARAEYVPIGEVIAELGAWIRAGHHADYLTLSGSGEPTLHRDFGRVIDFARVSTDIPVALLTNGALLTDPAVRAAAAKADVVKVSLSAWDDESLARINRPSPEIRFDSMVDGQRRFRDEFAGELRMEVFVMRGVNTSERRIEAIARIAKTIRPDRVELNTAIRPPCEEYALPASVDEMRRLAAFFDPPAEVIAEFDPGAATGDIAADGTRVERMLERRPCTLDDVCASSGLHRNEALKHLGRLVRDGRARIERTKTGAWYSVVREHCR